MASAKDLLARLKASRPYEAWKRYGDANGDLLAAGVGYFAFFSVFPALALAFTIFGFVLRGRPELLDTIADSLNSTLPGMVRTPSHPDGVISLTTPQSVTLTVTGVVSLVTLLVAGLGWVGALRTGIRGVFGLEAATGNVVRTKLRDAGVLASLGLGVALSAVLTSAVGGLTGKVAEWVGLPGGDVVVTVVGLLVGCAFDMLLMVLLLRVLSGVHLPWRVVRDGALVGAVLLTVLKYFGGVLVARASGNPLLGAVAVAVGLLFWLNLMSRVVLFSAAWAAGLADRDALAEEASGGPVGAPAAVARPVGAFSGTGAPAAPPSRAGDRVSLAAGAVIGAAGAAAVAGARRLRRR